MKIDNLRRYIELRDSLAREKTQLQQRLQQINRALGQGEAIERPPPARLARGPAAAWRGQPALSGLSLRDAVLQVTTRKPMSKHEILDAVRRIGYRFSTTNPSNSLGVILYGRNPRFQNAGGRFSPAGITSTAAVTRGASRPARRKRRVFSAEGRERIAAAQRARWAKMRAA